jgi:hypothetical protein
VRSSARWRARPHGNVSSWNWSSDRQEFSEVKAVKVALYARYSSDNQRDASIADQLRVCRAYAERQGWSICEEYTDHAVSGATLLRAGFQVWCAMRWTGDSTSCSPSRWIASAATRKTPPASSSASALQQPESRTEPNEALRGLVDAIVLTPVASGKELGIELRGNLAAMLGATVQRKRPSESDDLSLQVTLVAGARNQRYLRLWSGAP